MKWWSNHSMHFFISLTRSVAISYDRSSLTTHLSIFCCLYTCSLLLGRFKLVLSAGSACKASEQSFSAASTGVRLLPASDWLHQHEPQQSGFTHKLMYSGELGKAMHELHALGSRGTVQHSLACHSTACYSITQQLQGYCQCHTLTRSLQQRAANKAGKSCLLCILGESVGRQLPMVLLHAVHDVKFVIAYVITLLVLTASLQGKGYYRQPLVPTNQHKVPCKIARPVR